jgi:peptidoglycan/xylan/chitin deacetylase (PgdA/CDA1 family)
LRPIRNMVDSGRRLAAQLPPAGWRLLPSRRRCVRSVLYHHVGSDQPCIAKLGVTIDPERFERHVRLLVREYEPVTLRQVIDGDLPERPLLVTFDDCYRSVLDVAAPILRRYGVPATLFLTTGPVFSGGALLDQVASLAEVETRGNLGSLFAGTPLAGRADVRTAADLLLGAAPSLTAGHRRELADAIASRLGSTRDAIVGDSGLFLAPADLPRLAALGFGFGAHTDSHVHVRALAAEEFATELVEPAKLIARAVGTPIEAFSYPFGSAVDHTAAAATVLESAGCRLSFLVEGATNAREAGPVLYRSSVAKMDANEAILELEVLARLRGIRKGAPRPAAAAT